MACQPSSARPGSCHGPAKSMVQIENRDLDFAYFCLLRRAGPPGVSAAPGGQGAPGVPGVGQMRPGPGASTPNQCLCASRLLVEVAAGRPITSDFARTVRETRGALPKLRFDAISLPSLPMCSQVADPGGG